MGMAAPQCRLLALTSRKNDIGSALQRCSLDKMTLSRDMQRVTKKYQEALNSRVLRWSDNSGVSYVDLSYNNLMRPGRTNKNVPYLITDNTGKVVVDSAYKKYAEMISPDGSSGGDWESNRVKILSDLTGIPAETIEQSVATASTVNSNADNVNALQEEVDKLEAKAITKMTGEQFVSKCFGNVTGVSTNVQQYSTNVYNDYKNASSGETVLWNLGMTEDAAKTSVDRILDQIYQNASSYLSDFNLEKFKKAMDATSRIYSDYIASAANGQSYKNIDDFEKNGSQLTIAKVNNQFAVRVEDLIDCILNQFEIAGAQTSSNSSNSDITYYHTVDRNSAAYQAYIAKKEELDAAKSDYKNSVDDDNQILTAEQESMIEFYDRLFSAIVEMGWTSNPKVEDTDYLNQMLQNNQYFITTVKPSTDKDGKECYSYDTSIASNVDYVYSVNDSDKQNQALVALEHEKSIITEKESRIDVRMQNLETEQAAINEMIKGIESGIKDGIDRNFSVMS